jgi:predicted HTH transcriptional regulator
MLDPKIDFSIETFDYDSDRHICIFIIPAAKNIPVKFINIAYIRIASITRKLKDFPEKESKIWKKKDIAFEKEIAKHNLSPDDIIKLLSTETYFDLM